MKYWSPYIAGACLGIVLLASIVISGKGLGASGAFTRISASVVGVVAKEHAENNYIMGDYFKDNKSPLSSRIVFMLFGVLLGGLISGIQTGHFNKGMYVSKRFTKRKRLIFALVGGMISGWASGLALGCTSSQALSGGAMFSIGSWIFMFSVFGGGYMFSYFFRKQWND